MKQVIARGGRVVVVDVPAPECRDNELVVKTMCSVISTGTEIWTVEATEPLSPRKLVGDRSKLRKGISLVRKVWSDEGINGVLDYMKEIRNTVVPLGYSLSGVVVEVGKDVSDITLGERVACAGEGKACHAEYVAVPRNLATKLPDGVSFEDGAFAAIGAIAIQGYRRSCAQLGEYVAVLGVGLVGNLTLQICKSAGCRVAALDTRSTRIELAKEVGADAAFHVDDPSLEERLFHFTNGRGFDAVIIGAATSSDGPINLASRICRDKGRVVIIGRIGMNLERKQYYQKELDLVMSRSLGPGRYDANYEEKGIDYPFPYVRWTLNRNMEAFLDMVYQKKVRLNPIVTERYEIAKAERAFDSLKTGASMAVLLTYGSQEVSIPASHSVILDHPHIIGRINVALVGPGNFAKETMIPILRSIKHYNLRWVVASNPINALKASRRYHFQRMGTSYDEVLHDEDSDLLVICTPNNLHCKMVLEAMKAKKTVFVEKPLCLNEGELNQIVREQLATGSSVFVGFNRRYSKFIRIIKENMGKMDCPFLVNYRVNADYIPSTRWVQDPAVGGGRIVAEGCHFLDLFNFLLGPGEPEVSVTTTQINGSTTVARDNYIATLRYPNGSVASLTYSALGNRNLGRERLEIFGQGTAMILEDFRRLEIIKPQHREVIESRSQDKGHRKQLEELARFMRGEDSSMTSFSDSVESMKLTFRVEKAARLSAENHE